MVVISAEKPAEVYALISPAPVPQLPPKQQGCPVTIPPVSQYGAVLSCNYITIN